MRANEKTCGNFEKWVFATCGELSEKLKVKNEKFWNRFAGVFFHPPLNFISRNKIPEESGAFASLQLKH